MKPEEILQINFMNWLSAHTRLSPWVFHIANERSCSPQEGRKLKRMGVRPGVSDIFCAVPAGKYHGMFLELKTESGKLSPKQEDFLHQMTQQGYCCDVAFGYEHAKQAILNYISHHPESAFLLSSNTAHPAPPQSPSAQ